MTEHTILRRFPRPPDAVLRALDKLKALQRADPHELASIGDLTDLARPWDPSTCPRPLRADLWRWCDEVAAWINCEYAWRPGEMIPACWPHHAHIARELPVLAIQRWQAETTSSLDAIDAWQRYALPEFSQRMFTRLGESACCTGRHVDWPAAARDATYQCAASVAERAAVIHRDRRES